MHGGFWGWMGLWKSWWGSGVKKLGKVVKVGKKSYKKKRLWYNECI